MTQTAQISTARQRVAFIQYIFRSYRTYKTGILADRDLGYDLFHNE